MAGMGGTAVSLLIGGKMHISNLLFPRETVNVSGPGVGAGTAFMGGIKTASVAVEPIVVSLHGVLGVAALAGIVVASSSPVVVAAVAASTSLIV